VLLIPTYEREGRNN